MHDISRRDFGKLMGAAALGGSLVPQVTMGAQASQVSELCFMPATELVARIKRKDVSAREVLQAHLAQIERVNSRVNAIVTLAADKAMADAGRADESTARGGPLGPLHGLPIAHKDLVDTA
jgi:amidase